MRAAFFILIMTFGAFLAPSALAQSSMVRVGCEGADVGAEVSINGQFRGECPLDIQVGAGNLQLRIVKKVDASYERVFEQDIRMGDGTVKRVDARLGPMQLNADGLRIEAQRKETARLRDEAVRLREEARLRDLAAAEQQRQEVVARGLVELKAQGLEPGNGKSFRDCADCPEMVWVPPGKILHQSKYDFPYQRWQKQVDISYPLAVGKFEVTFDEWELCVADGACSKEPGGKGPAEGVTRGTFSDTPWGRGRQPVIGAVRAEVLVYLAWLSKKTGHTYRFLSMAEFIHAARGGRSTKFPWGDEVGSNNANCKNCGARRSGEQPSPVGSYAANDWGLHDMVGNVPEMVADCLIAPSGWSQAPVNGSPMLSGCITTLPAETRLLIGDGFHAMGGGWQNSLDPLGLGIIGDTFYEKHNTVGIRVARSLPASTPDTSKAK